MSRNFPEGNYTVQTAHRSYQPTGHWSSVPEDENLTQKHAMEKHRNNGRWRGMSSRVIQAKVVVVAARYRGPAKCVKARK